MQPIPNRLSFIRKKKSERKEISEVRLIILNRLLYVFSLIGLPAVIIGAAQTYQQGRWIFSALYLGIYLLFLISTFGSRRLPYRARAMVLVSCLYLIALAVLFRIGLSGVGTLILVGVCFMSAVFFGLRGGIIAISISLVSMGVMGAGMSTGFIEINPDHMLTSLSPMAWITFLCVFFMITCVTILSSEMFARRIEASVDLLEEHKERLEVNNRLLLQEIEERKGAEAAVRSSEQKYRSVIENIQDVFYRSDDRGRLLMGSPSGARMFGFDSVEEMIGLPLDDFWPDASERQLLLDHVKQDGAVRDFEAVLKRKDGSTFYGSFSTHFYYDDDGHILGTEGIIRDITERKRAEEALQASERKYRSVIENIQDVFYRLDKKGKLLMVSPSGARMFGYDSIEEMMRYPLEHFMPDERERQVLIEKLKQDGSLNDFESEMRRKDGSTFLTSSTIHYYYDDDGHVLGTEGIIRDITERIKAEEAVRESEEKFRNLVETTSDWIWEIDADDRYSYASPKVFDLLGYQPQEILGLKVFDLMPQDEASRLSNVWEKIRSARRPCYALENVNLHKDGHRVLLETSAVPRLDTAGNLLGYRGIDRDITERKQAEEERRRLSNYLDNIINSMPSVLVGVDREGRVTQWNVAAEKATGIRPEEALGQVLDQVMPVLGRELKKVKESMSEQVVKSEVKVPRRSEGMVCYDDITVYPLMTNGVEGAVIRIDDVTERVRMEEMMIQSEKMLSVGGLAAGMAHEINNPLGVILQASQNVLRRVSPELPANSRIAEECGTSLTAIRSYLERREVPEFLEDIRKSGERAAGIVSNMLSFSRKAEGEEKPTDLAELLDQTLALAGSDYDLKKKYDFRQIQIVREYNPDIPMSVCQASKIQQVFLNILRNGAEAMYEHRAKSAELGIEVGTPRFILRVKRQNEMVRVEIEDNGAGLDETTRRRVFEPFFTTKAPGIGTGLGLSVSYFIITEEHRGTLSVESRPGGGTNFIVCIPRNRSMK